MMIIFGGIYAVGIARRFPIRSGRVDPGHPQRHTAMISSTASTRNKLRNVMK